MKNKEQSKNSAETIPKKDYIRIKLIRGYKRVIRQFSRGIRKPPTKGFNKIKKNNPEQLEAWTLLKNNTEANFPELREVLITYTEPLTDDKSNRTRNNEHVKGRSKKTSLDTLIQEYFSSSAIVENFKLYVDYLFEHQSPKTLKKKFRLSCCETENCNTCSEDWKNLHIFIREIFTSCPSFDEFYEDVDELVYDCLVFDDV